MFKKIAITVILLGLLTAGSLIATDKMIWTVIITADPGVPTNGTVTVTLPLHPTHNPYPQNYHGPDEYPFMVTAWNLGCPITSEVVAGEYSDSETKIMNLNELWVHLHLSTAIPVPPEDIPEDE